MPAPPPPQVTVSTPLDREVQEWDEYPGRLEAKEVVDVRPRVSGYITSVSFKEGSIVQKGDPLFTIDPRPYEAELVRTQGEVSRAEAQLALAETQFKRTAGLVPSQAASELELDERRAQRDEAKAALAVAKANVEAAQLDVDFTNVRAPITGRVGRIGTSEVYVTVGNLVTGGGQAPATLLTNITSLDPIYCYVDADERSVLKYQRLVRENKRPDAQGGQKVPAKLALLNENDFAHTGYIDFVDNRVDPTTGTLSARGIFPNPEGVMTPGLFGRMRVPGGEPYRTLLVAELAIQSDQSTKYVLTVDAQDTVQITPVVTGALFGNLRAIKSGLNGDERVIVNGILRARPGSKVQSQVSPMPGGDDAQALSTTRIVEPPVGAPTTAPAPQTEPSTRPTTRDDSAGEATQSRGVQPVAPMVGVAPGVGE